MTKRRISPSVAILAASLWLIAMETTKAQVVAEGGLGMRRNVLPSPERPTLDTKQSATLFATRIEARGGFDTDEMAILSDGTVTWSEMFVSPSSHSMSLCLSGIALPQGGELTVSDTLGTTSRAVWIADGATEAITPTILSSAIVIRYVGPSTTLPSFTVTAANCGFRPIGRGHGSALNKSAGDFGSSGSCEIPAICDAAASELRRGVCRLIVNGKQFGTGTLVNNSAQDRAPLVLTSAHVVGGTVLTSCEALFNYEEPVCQNGYSIFNYGTETINGATLEAFDAGTDMAVLRLKESPSVYSAPFWAGWSRTTNVGADDMLTCVHHPYGDTKKVSTTIGAASYASYTGAKNALGETMTSASHWLVDRWETGTTEGGSSGSSLVTTDGLIIGALTGGTATCRNPTYDYFWMIAQAWEAQSHGYKTLAQVLDPENLNLQSLSGLNYEKEGMGIVTLSNFDPTDEDLSEADAMSCNSTSYIQPVTSPSTRTYWAIGFNAASAATTSNTAMVEIGVTTSLAALPNKWEAVRLKLLSTSGSVTVPLSTPITAGAGQKIYVHIRPSGFGSTDELTLLTTDASDDMMYMLTGDSQTAVAGKRIALNTICTQDNDSAIKIVVNPNLSVSMADGVASLSGAAMDLVAVYDIRGRNVWSMHAQGRTELEVDMCGMPTGLYIIRTLLSDGSQARFKILNY